MTFFKELSSYSYLSSGDMKRAKNVGWLDGNDAFTKGDVEPSVLEKMRLHCLHPVNRTRGVFCCPFCTSGKGDWIVLSIGGKEVVLGNAEIRVRGKDGNVYAAPNLILHYVEVHSYLPPRPFLDAVMDSLPGWHENRSFMSRLLGR